MCSGCSGNYAGDFDFEDSGESRGVEGGGELAAWICGRPEKAGTRLSAGGAGRFEVEAGSESETAAENYVVLVSATQIIEIRMIAAKCTEISDFGGSEAAKEATVRKHSTAESAKYYQTQPKGAGSSSYAPQVSRFHRIAVRAAAEFKRWVRWARRALGK